MVCRNNSALFIFFISFLFVPVCIAQEKAIAPLVADQILHQAGLKQVWQAKLAVKASEQVEKLMLLGDKIYALTSDNYLFCLNRQSGILIFGMQLAPEGFPVLQPQLYGDQLVVLAGSKLMLIDPAQGAAVYTLNFGYTVVCPVVRNKENLYAAGVDRRIHAISAADKLPLFMAAADNGSMPTSVLAADEFVIFTTDRGNVICISATGPQMLWQFDTMEKITAGLIRDNNDLYAASWDTRLYKLNVATGKQVWKCQLDGVLKDSPRVTQNAVYQYVTGKGVTAINKQDGKPLWTVDDGIDLLAETNGKAYIMVRNRTVAAVDSVGGKQLFTINFAQAALQTANTVDGNIYVADRAGRVACIAAN